MKHNISQTVLVFVLLLLLCLNFIRKIKVYICFFFMQQAPSYYEKILAVSKQSCVPVC